MCVGTSYLHTHTKVTQLHMALGVYQHVGRFNVFKQTRGKKGLSTLGVLV